MIKYLALTMMIATPFSASALTAEQELTQKCDMKMEARVKNVQGKSLYRDKKICQCIVQDIKSKAKPDELQDIADFLTEKYDGAPMPDPKKASFAFSARECLSKLYTKEQLAEEGKKISDANKVFIEKRKKEMEKEKAERDKKIAEAQEKFKKEMANKKPTGKQPAPARNFTPIPGKAVQPAKPANKQ